MKRPYPFITLALSLMLAACGQDTAQESGPAESRSEAGVVGKAATVVEAVADAEAFEIAPGLEARVLRAGTGEVAEPGDAVEVHYTGWLYDENAPDKRGEKFDSSIDRGDRFVFPLGARRVIRGWDEGVAGMQVGEVRELTIAPAMAYGDRGAGDAIPPGATLVFEVELFGTESLGEPGSTQ